MSNRDQALKQNILVVTYAAVLIAGLLAIYYALPVILTCLLGIGFGVLLSPLLDWFQARFKLPRGLGAFLVLFTLFLIVLLLFYGVYLIAADQFIRLQESAPAIMDRLQEIARNAVNRVPWLSTRLKSLDLAGTASSFATPLWSGMLSGVAAITSAAFASLLGLYTAVGSKEYHEMIIKPFPPRLRSTASQFFIRCAQVLRQWFKAQLTGMIIIGCLTGAGLGLVGIDYWAVFGLLTATLCIIPYVGTLIVIVIASLITLASDPSNFPWVLLVFAITQQIEGNLILPMVMKGQADLPEVPLLIFMLLLGSWLGLFGVFIAPPLFAVLKVAYTDLYLPRIEPSIEG